MRVPPSGIRDERWKDLTAGDCPVSRFGSVRCAPQLRGARVHKGERTMKRLFAMMLTVGLFAMMFSSVGAAWHIDGDGFGFVGKGDVQTAKGWKNQQLQAGAEGVVFSYGTLTTRSQECRDNINPDNGQPIWTYEDSYSVRSVGKQVDYDTRNNKKGAVTGFFLIGFDGPAITTGSLQPNCPAGYTPYGPVEITREISQLMVDGISLD
jgi:hypothetical protein